MDLTIIRCESYLKLKEFLIIVLFLCYKLEVYAAREKNGIYIPKDRYLQEEAEKKVQSILIDFLCELLCWRQIFIDKFSSSVLP